MSHHQYSVLSTQYWPLILAFAALHLGCSSSNAPQSPTEPSFAAQLLAVQSGNSDEISVSETPLSDDDLAPLASAPTLRVLLIDHPASRITSAGLRHLGRLSNLKHLRLRGSAIDDDALAEIAHIQNLQILNAPRASFTDVGLAHLKNLPNLDMLRFGSPHVTDSGIKTLTEFPVLKRLHLIDVPISDNGLRELAQMEQLESLYIDGADLSDAAVDDLFRIRPHLHVHFNQQHHDRDPQKSHP